MKEGLKVEFSFKGKVSEINTSLLKNQARSLVFNAKIEKYLRAFSSINDSILKPTIESYII